MNVRHADEKMERLERDPRFNAGFDQGLVDSFRRKMNFIRQAVDERDFRSMRSLKYEKLRGNRAGQWSMRLNDKYRLILEIEEGEPKNTVVIIEIVDYH